MMQFTATVRQLLRRMQNELPQELHYHNIAHTKDVYRAARRIAVNENLSDQDTKLVLTAALLHDMGFVVAMDNHEELSCRLAREILPKNGYSSQEIAQVESIIMVTKLPQNPQTLNERIMCDADLDYLGRDDYYDISERLFEEWNLVGRHLERDEWEMIQVKFLSAHRYFTETCLREREPKKQEHLAAIKRRTGL